MGALTVPGRSRQNHFSELIHGLRMVSPFGVRADAQAARFRSMDLKLGRDGCQGRVSIALLRRGGYTVAVRTLLHVAYMRAQGRDGAVDVSGAAMT